MTAPTTKTSDSEAIATLFDPATNPTRPNRVGASIEETAFTTEKNEKNSADLCCGVRLPNSERLSACVPPDQRDTQREDEKLLGRLDTDAADRDECVHRQPEQYHPLRREPVRELSERERTRDADELDHHQRADYLGLSEADVARVRRGEVDDGGDTACVKKKPARKMNVTR